MTNKEWLDYLAHNAPDELAAWFDAEHVETEERALDGDTAAQDGDSRDKLEADVRKIAEAYNMDTQRHGTERFAHELYYSIIHLLDRQRAIDDSICDDCSSDFYKLQEAYDALEEEVDKLTTERDELKGQVFTLKCECDDLENERDKLQEQLRIGWECECRLQAERERYREKFGKCIDYADAIHALMDDEGLA